MVNWLLQFALDTGEWDLPPASVNYVLGGAMFVLGLLLVFHGERVFQFLFAVLGGAAGAFIGYYIGYELLGRVWLAVLLLVVLAIVFALILKYLVMFGLSAAAGGLLGYATYLGLVSAGGGKNLSAALGLAVGIAVLVLLLYFARDFIAVLTSAIGAGLVGYGIYLIGLAATSFTNGIYGAAVGLGVGLALFISGAYLQIKRLEKKRAEEAARKAQLEKDEKDRAVGAQKEVKEQAGAVKAAIAERTTGVAAPSAATSVAVGVVKKCPNCGGKMEWMEFYKKYFCARCAEYIEE